MKRCKLVLKLTTRHFIFFYIFFVVILSFNHSSSAKKLKIEGRKKRISRVFFDKSKVYPAYIRPGLGTVIQFPCQIQEAKIGPSAFFSVALSGTLKRELSIFLVKGKAQPTNLIIRCLTSSFVFDLIPSAKLHQDLIQITSSYGSPGFDERKLLNSSFSKMKPTQKEESKLKDNHSMLPKKVAVLKPVKPNVKPLPPLKKASTAKKQALRQKKSITLSAKKLIRSGGILSE